MALPNFTEMIKSPDYQKEYYESGEIKSIKSEDKYISSWVGSDKQLSPYVKQEYYFNEQGLLTSGVVRDSRISLDTKNKYAEQPYEKEVYSVDNGIITANRYQAVGDKAQSVKFFERETFAGGQQIGYSLGSYLTPTQKEYQQAREERADNITPPTVLNSAAEKYLFPKANKTISQKLTPEQGALILGVAQQQVKASSKFEALRSRRLAEYKQQITKPQEVKATLAGGTIELTGTVEPFKASNEQREFNKALKDFEKVGYQLKDVEGTKLSNLTLELERDNKKTYLDFGIGLSQETVNVSKNYFNMSNLYNYETAIKTSIGVTNFKVIGIVPKETIFRTDIARKLKPIRVIETKQDSYGVKKLFKDITTFGGKGYEQAEKGVKYIEKKTRFIDEYSSKLIPSFDETGLQISDKLNKFYPDFDIKEFENQSTLYDQKIPKIKAIATGTKIIREFSKFNVGTIAGAGESLRTKPRKIIATAGTFYLLEPVIAGVGSIKYLGKPLLKGVGALYGGSVLTRLAMKTDSYSQGKKLGEIITTELVPMSVGSLSYDYTVKTLIPEFKAWKFDYKLNRWYDRIKGEEWQSTPTYKISNINRWDKPITDIEVIQGISPIKKTQKPIYDVEPINRGISVIEKKPIFDEKGDFVFYEETGALLNERQLQIYEKEIEVLKDNKPISLEEPEKLIKVIKTGNKGFIIDTPSQQRLTQPFVMRTDNGVKLIKKGLIDFIDVPKIDTTLKNEFGKTLSYSKLFNYEKQLSIKESTTFKDWINREPIALLEFKPNIKLSKTSRGAYNLGSVLGTDLYIPVELDIKQDFREYDLFDEYRSVREPLREIKPRLREFEKDIFKESTESGLKSYYLNNYSVKGSLRLKNNYLFDKAKNNLSHKTRIKQNLNLDLFNNSRYTQTLKLKQKIELKTEQKQQQRQDLRIAAFNLNLELSFPEPNFPEPNFPEPLKLENIKLPKFNFNFKKRGNKEKEYSYDVFGKEKGKYLKLNKEPLPFNKARNMGAEAVDNTSSAQFKIKEAKKKTKQNDDFGFYKNSKFRKSKTNSYIELNKNRIDTSGELAQITIKGWIANRNKNRFSF